MNYIGDLNYTFYGVKLPSGGLLETKISDSTISADVAAVTGKNTVWNAGNIFQGVFSATGSVFDFLTARKQAQTASVYSSMQNIQPEKKGISPFAYATGIAALLGTVYLATK